MMRAMAARLGSSLLTAALALACDLGPTPSFTVTMPGHAEFTMRVFDQSGLVVAARSADRNLGASLDGEATADPDHRQLTVDWMGGVCRYGPALTLSGTTGALHIVLEPNAGPGLPFFASCPAAGMLFGLTLTLSAPVRQDAISLEVRK